MSRFQRAGQGQPTVVLLTGLGVPSVLWHELGDLAEDVTHLINRDAWEDQPFLAPALAQEFSVITYDRAGVTGVAPTQPRQLNDFVEELDAVLEEATVHMPFVLLGHSLGGLIALEYTRRHPNRIAALVLLDSSHPNQLPRFAHGASVQQMARDTEERALMAAEHPERPDLESLLSQSQNVAVPGQFGALPLLVITRGVKPWPGEGPSGSPMTREDWQLKEQTWQDLQRALTALSTTGRQIRLPDSGHYVHLDEPRRVIDEVKGFLRGLRASTTSSTEGHSLETRP